MPTNLEEKQKIADKLLNDPNLGDYIKVGFVDEIKIRNCKIIKDYMKLRKHFSHIHALDKTADKYCLSTDRILFILYGKLNIS